MYSFSIAANVLLAFYPFLIVLISVSKLFFSASVTLAAIQIALSDYFPASFTEFLYTKNVHENLPIFGKPVQFFAVVLLLFTSSGVFQPLEVALNQVWGIRQNRSFMRNQAVSLALIFACGALAIISMMLTAFNHASVLKLMESAPSWLPKSTLAWIPVLAFKMAALPLTVFGLYLIYRFLPNAKTPNIRVIAAAVMTGVLLEILKYVAKLVWPWFFSKLESEYGVFKYSATLLFMAFLTSMLVLAGAEWAARSSRSEAEAGG